MCVAPRWKKNTQRTVAEAVTEGSFMVYTVSVVCSATDSEVLFWLYIMFEGIQTLWMFILTKECKEYSYCKQRTKKMFASQMCIDNCVLNLFLGTYK